MTELTGKWAGDSGRGGGGRRVVSSSHQTISKLIRDKNIMNNWKVSGIKQLFFFSEPSLIAKLLSKKMKAPRRVRFRSATTIIIFTALRLPMLHRWTRYNPIVCSSRVKRRSKLCNSMHLHYSAEPLCNAILNMLLGVAAHPHWKQTPPSGSSVKSSTSMNIQPTLIQMQPEGDWMLCLTLASLTLAFLV